MQLPKNYNKPFWFLSRKRSIEITMRKIYNGSVTPNNEFWIICGVNPNSELPINDNNGEKNFLDRK